MRTTLELDDALVAEAQRWCPGLTKTALIEEALRALIERSVRRRMARWDGDLPVRPVVRRVPRVRNDGEEP
jgi:Arc/MetJ family transcription regulator